MGQHKPMPTEARITRFVKAVTRGNPDLTRVRLTADGELIAEKGDKPTVAPGDYDCLDFGRT